MSTDTWIVVADAVRARIFATDRTLTDWRPVRDLVHPEARADTKELVSDPQYGTARRGPRSHPVPTVDRHDLEGQRFARELAQDLQRSLDHGDFADLILVAPPGMMGWTRQAMSTTLARHVKAEVLKDYSLQPPHQVQVSVLRELVQQL